MLRTLTIRVPETLYYAVHGASHDERKSMNKFCEARLREAVEVRGYSPDPQAASEASRVPTGEAVSS